MEDAHTVLQNKSPDTEEEEKEVAEKLTQSMEKELEKVSESKDSSVPQFPKGEIAFFGVFDGHGGKKGCRFCCNESSFICLSIFKV